VTHKIFSFEANLAAQAIGLRVWIRFNCPGFESNCEILCAPGNFLASSATANLSRKTLNHGIGHSFTFSLKFFTLMFEILSADRLDEKGRHDIE
jgi:hypothetical protein